MGSYATTTSISLLLPQFLNGNTTTSDAEGTAIFAKHIDRAEGVVNAAASVFYELPFPVATIPPLIRTITEDIACYYAMRASYSQDGQSHNPYADAYKKGMEQLEQVRKGDLPLLDTNGSEVPNKTATRILSSTENYTPIFGLDDPQDWNRDQDEIDAQDLARG